jgi:hypothetical protein
MCSAGDNIFGVKEQREQLPGMSGIITCAVNGIELKDISRWE